MFETTNQMPNVYAWHIFQETYQDATISRKITHGIEWIVISLWLERKRTKWGEETPAEGG